MRTEGGTDAAVSPFTYDDGVINVGSRSTDHNRVRTGWGALAASNEAVSRYFD